MKHRISAILVFIFNVTCSFFYSLINYPIFEVDEPPAADILCQVERKTVQQVT